MCLPGGIWGFDAAATLCSGHHSKLLPTELQTPAKKNWLWWENKTGPTASWVVVCMGSTARLISLILCQLRLCWNNNMTLAWSTERLWCKETNQQISESEASCGVTAQQTTQWGFFCLLFDVTWRSLIARKKCLDLCQCQKCHWQFTCHWQMDQKVNFGSWLRLSGSATGVSASDGWH